MLRAGPSSLAQHASRNDSSDSSKDSQLSSESEQSEAPRVAQWIDDEELHEVSSDEDLASEEGNPDLTTLKRDLTTLPLGALAKAQKAIKDGPKGQGNNDGNDSDSSEEFEITPPGATRGVTDTSAHKSKSLIKHRSNKHAPMEVTSKRPVPRRRQVVEIHTIQPRDPRFSDLSGGLSAEHYRTQYGFISELHVGELSTLKQSLARARKSLIASPRDQREEREKEVKRLELAVKRAESTVNRERREEAERKALEDVYHEEKGKRRAGKKGWWLKDSDKKAVRVRARMDAIAASGGKPAVKKAIEKKQRKIGQKEKKMRPFAPPQKRPRDEEGAHEIRSKRRRKIE